MIDTRKFSFISMSFLHKITKTLWVASQVHMDGSNKGRNLRYDGTCNFLLVETLPSWIFELESKIKMLSFSCLHLRKTILDVKGSINLKFPTPLMSWFFIPSDNLLITQSVLRECFLYCKGNISSLNISVYLFIILQVNMNSWDLDWVS